MMTFLISSLTLCFICSSVFKQRLLTQIRLSAIEPLPYLALRAPAQHQVMSYTGHLRSLSQSDILKKVSRETARHFFNTPQYKIDDELEINHRLNL